MTTANDTTAGAEIDFGDPKPTLAGAIAAHVMGLSWAMGDDIDTNCDRHGDVQNAIEAACAEFGGSAATLTQPPAGAGCGVEGWQLVPTTMLPEMIGAFWRVKNTGSTEVGETGDDRSDAAAYRTMLAAAPSPAQQGSAGEREDQGASCSAYLAQMVAAQFAPKPETQHAEDQGASGDAGPGSCLSGDAAEASSSLRDGDPSRSDSAEPEVATGCGYSGYEFGGGYLDSLCIDGRLWDLDSCDGPGSGLTHGGEWPCPRCNTKSMLEDALDEALSGSTGESMGRPHCPMVLWEAATEKALAENDKVAAPLLAGYGTLELEDWPDREAVYAGTARWDVTEPRSWTFAPALATEAGTAETAGLGPKADGAAGTATPEPHPASAAPAGATGEAGTARVDLEGLSAAPVAWSYEFHEFGDVWTRHVILNRPDGGANPPTKHHGSAVRLVTPLFAARLRPVSPGQGSDREAVARIAAARPHLRQSGQNVTLAFHDENAATEAYDALDRALDRHRTPEDERAGGRAPERGWRLVPDEPTEAMLTASNRALGDHIASFSKEVRGARWGKPSASFGYRVPSREKAAVRYRAMLAAAPPSPAQTTEGRA